MSINNKRAYTEYTVTQPTTDFAIGFDDYDEGSKDIILVTLNGVLVDTLGYAAMRKNESTVTITPAITEGTVRLTRETDIDEPFHKFTAGALFSAKSMDENFQQVRHSQQEVRDGFVFLEYNTNGIVQASKEATAQAKAATVEATASAVRAETAADTAVQAVGSLQGVVNAATTATTNANTATATANTAASQATAATTSAQNAAQAANTAKQEATAAAANANAATVDTLAATDRVNEAVDVVADLVVGKVRAQDVSTVDGSTQDVKNTEFRNELDALPFVSLEGYGAEEGADNSDAIQEALDYLWEIGGGTLTTNLKTQLITKVCVFHSNTIVDMNNCEITFSAEGCFASAVYNTDKTAYGYASKNPQYYNQSVSNLANNPISRITSDSLLKSDTITVEDTTGLAIGDLLFVSNGYCDMWRVMEKYESEGTGANRALEDWVRPEVDLWRCEVVKVKSISGNTITLEDELSNNYFAVPKTYGFFSDENNVSYYSGYNFPTVERLGGVVNTTFKNIRGILTNGETAIRANLSVNTHVEDSTFKGTGAGVEFNTCYASSIKACTGDTTKVIYILGRGSSNCSMADINTVYNSGDASVYIFEGSHECSMDNIKVTGKGGYRGTGAAKGGVYFNTCWDCIGTNIIGKNLDTVAMVGFCRGNVVCNNIIGVNVDLLINAYASYSAYGSKGVRRGTYTPTVNMTLYTNSLISVIDSNEIEFKDFYDADSYIVGKTSGRVHVFRSSSVLIDNINAPNTAIDYSLPDHEKYTGGATRVIVRNCEFSDGYFMGVYPKYLRHSEIYNTILNGVLYLKEQKNTVLKNVRVLNKAKVATGLSLDSAMYTRIDSCVIRGETYAIDFKAGSASDGSKYGSSTLYMDNTVLEAPTLFKDYVAMDGMYNGSLTTVGLKPMAKSTLLTRYPDLTQFGFMGIDGVTSNWKLIQRAGATEVELRTTGELSNATHICNYIEYKWLGKEVYNSTTNKFMRARGNTKTAVWQNVDGTDNNIVPV